MKIAAVCETDPQAGSNGKYNIRSLYFDDYTDSAYNANEMGIEPRSKWRLRIYNHDAGLIRLEQKIKVQGRIRKECTEVPLEFYRQLLANVDDMEYPTENKIINRFLTDCYTKELRPRIIVEYDREPYIYDVGDVRITFDTGICCSNQIENFFDKDIFLTPVLGEVRLLEVKYTELLPGFIHSLLDTGELRQSTFSKYYLGRRLGECPGYDYF